MKKYMITLGLLALTPSIWAIAPEIAAVYLHSTWNNNVGIHQMDVCKITKTGDALSIYCKKSGKEFSNVGTVEGVDLNSSGNLSDTYSNYIGYRLATKGEKLTIYCSGPCKRK